MENGFIELRDGENAACHLMRTPLINAVLRSRSLFDDAILESDFSFRLGRASRIKVSSGSMKDIDLAGAAGKSMLIAIVDEEDIPAMVAWAPCPVYIVMRSRLNENLSQVILLSAEEEVLDNEPVQIKIRLPKWMKQQIGQIKDDLCVGYSEVVKLALGQAGFLDSRVGC